MQDLSRIYFPIVLLISLLVPIVIFPPAFNYVLIKLAVAQFLLGIFLILWLYQNINKGLISVLRDPVYLPMLLLLTWGLVSLYISNYRYASIEEIEILITYLFLYFAVVNSLKNEKEIVGIVTCIIIVMGGLSFQGLSYYFKEKTSVIPSTFGNQNFFSAYLILIIPLVVALGTYHAIRKNFFLSSLLFVIFLASLSLVFIINSQGALLGLAASVIFSFLAFTRNIMRGKKRIYIILGCFLVLAAGILWFSNHIPLVSEVLQREIETGTLGIRLKIWQGTLRMIRQRLFTGWGIGTYYLVYPHFRIPEYFLNPHSVNATRHAHNELLEITSEMGIVGVSLFLWIVTLVFYQGVKAFNRNTSQLGRSIYAGLMAGVVALLVHNLTCVNLRFSSSGLYFYLFLGLISSLAGILSKRKPIEIKLPRKRILLSVPVIAAILFGWFYAEATLKLIKSSVNLKNGIIARNRKMWDKSINEYQKALFWNPYELRAYYRLSYAYAETGKVKEAMATYEKLKELAPDYAQIHYNLGVLYLKMGEWLKAKRELEREIELNPYEPKTHCNLAFVYLKLNQPDKAILHYRRAIFVQEQKKRIDPNTPDFGGGYAGMGDIWYSQKEWKKASNAYEEAIEANLKDTRILINLGNCYLHMKEFKKAKRVFKEVLEKEPSLTEVERIIGELEKNIK